MAPGAFADPAFPSPQLSVYDARKHDRVGVPGADIDRQFRAACMSLS